MCLHMATFEVVQHPFEGVVSLSRRAVDIVVGVVLGCVPAFEVCFVVVLGRSRRPS